MTDKKTQKTPKGYEIPIPKRSDFDVILDKVGKTPKRSTPRRGPTKGYYVELRQFNG